MQQSQLFVKTLKNAPKDEVSVSAQLLIRAGFIDKLMAGVYTLLPLGFRVYKKIEQIIREEINAIGGTEVFMPTLQPKENWTVTKRWDGIDVLFKMPTSEGKELALGPTHEEVVSPLVKKYISSYKDLPVYVYHIQNKFRNEKRAKGGLLRGREFIMKDLYSFHADQADLDNYYEKAKSAYTKIFSRCGLGEATYVTYASGGSFSKYSHEFQTVSPAGEDLIYLCANCRLGVNKEIFEEIGRQCPECGNKDLKEEKAIEVGNIFKLGTKFSAPFNLAYTDRAGAEKTVVMGCYGIGLQRLLATIVEIHHDERGMIWPLAVAPFAAHLLLLSGELKAKKLADDAYRSLLSSGYDVLYDDREDASAGEKFADADLIGCPYRLVVSDKTLKQDGIEVKKRDSTKTEIVKLDDIADYF